MDFPVKMSIAADGSVVALLEPMPKGRDAYRYATCLSSEERAYLTTLLAAVDFMNRPAGLPTLNDSGNMELRVWQGGKTNLVYFNWLPENSEWEPLGRFFDKLAMQADGVRRLEAGITDCLAGDWLQREKVIEAHKQYLRAPRRWEGASDAFRALAANMRPEEWTGFVALCLQEADPGARDLMLEALTTSRLPLCIPGRHAQQLQAVLKIWGELGPEGSKKRSERMERLFSPNRTSSPSEPKR